MRYSVRCTARECFLHEEAYFSEKPVAVILANAHEERWAEAPVSHVVIVKEYSPVQSSLETQTGKDKGQTGVGGEMLHA